MHLTPTQQIITLDYDANAGSSDILTISQPANEDDHSVPALVAWFGGSGMKVGVRTAAMLGVRAGATSMTVKVPLYQMGGIWITDPVDGLNGYVNDLAEYVEWVNIYWGDNTSDQFSPPFTEGYVTHEYSEPGIYSLQAQVYLTDNVIPNGQRLLINDPHGSATFTATLP